MFYIILTIHLSLCLILVGLVLLQQGKGAGMGAAFGGGSNTLFGAGGAGNVLTKATTSVALAFMITSILLVRSYGEQQGGTTIQISDVTEGSVMGDAPVAATSAEAPAAPAAPVAPAPAAPAAEVPSAQKAPEAK